MARPLVLCGPSGSGKSSLMNKLTDEFPEAFGFSVSHTTRNPREGEKDGVHYHYVSRDEMKRGIAAGEFIENAEFRSVLLLHSLMSQDTQFGTFAVVTCTARVKRPSALSSRLARYASWTSRWWG